MPRRRLLRGQTPEPSEDITASATAPSEPVTVPAEPVPQQSTLRRSRRTAPTASPVVEENSGNSDAGKWQEVVKDTGTETILNSPVIQLTKGSRHNLSPPKTNVEVTPQEDEKNSEAPATEVKETLRGRRGRVGLKTKSLGIAVQKSESNSSESMLEGAKVETAPVETPACDSTKNLEETDSLKVLKGTEDYNPKGTKSTPKKEHEELEENKPVFESKNVTDLEKKDVEPKKELKVNSSLDGREESGKERDDVHAPKEEVDEENAAEVQVKESAVEVQVEGSAAEVKVEESAAEVEVEESAAGVKIEESAAEVQIEESPAGFKVEESAAEVRIILRDDDGEEKMECDVQDKQLCSTGEVINETSVVITAVKKEMDGEALLQNMEKVSDAPAKTTRGGRTLKRVADKESVNAPETKVLVKECKETQSQSTEIVQSIPSSIIRQRKEIKEILDKKTLTSEHSASVKMETDLQSTEKNIKDDNLEAQELTNLKSTEEIIIKDDTIQAQEVTDLQSTEKIIKDDTVQAQAVIDLQSTEKINVDDNVEVQEVTDLQSIEKIIKDNNVQAQEVTDLQCSTVKMIKDDNVEAQEVTDLEGTEKMIKDDNVEAQEVTDLECTEKMIKNDNVEAQEVEVSGNQGIKEELSETNKAKLGTIRNDVTKISVKEIKEVQGGDILEKMETDDKIESLLTETSKGSVCVCSVLKGKEEVVEETGAPSKVNTIKVDTITELATEEVAGNQTEVTSCDIAEKMEIDVKDSLHKEKVQDSVSITLEDKKEIPNEDKVRKSPESGSRKGSPESSKERSLESENGRGPESQDKKRSLDSKGIKKCPEPQDEQKTPEDKEKGKSTLDDKTSSSPCEKSNKKIEDQDKEKDSQCRNNQGSSKVPSKADSDKDSITGCKLLINLKSDVKESNTFRQVVVLANSAYKIQLKGIESSHVKVVYEDNLSSETMIYNIIQKHRKEFGRNTLWIPLAGVYTFVNDEKVESCKNCKEPLRVIPKPSQLNDNKLLDYKILQLSRETCDTVQYRLGSDGLITIVPPLPALLALTENYNTHQDLHDAVDGYNLIVAKTTYERMRKKYNAICRTWIENSCERNKSWISVEVFQEYKNRGEANLFPVFSKFRYEIRLKNWFEAMEKFINLVLETTFPDMRVIESLSTSRKLDSTEVPPPPDDKVSKVVVVGSTTFTKDLQELTKDLNVEHLNENIDFDEDGLDFLNKLHNKHQSKTLCVILSGVSEVAQPVDSGPPKCKTVKCKEPIPVFVTKNDELGDPDFKDMEINRMVNIIVKEAFGFATLALKKLKEGSNIILAPIMPMCAIWSGNDTSHSHDALHRMYKQDPNVPHFIGDSSVWIKSAKALEIKWLNKIINSVKKDSYLCELMKQYKKEIPPVLEYVEDVTVPQVKDMQKAWSEMMAKLLRYYLVGSETKAVSEPVVNPVPVEVPVTLHSQGADSEPSAVGISEVVKLLDQDQVKRVPSGESAETSPQNNAPPLLDQQTKVNRIPPGGKAPMSSHSKALLLDHQTQVNRKPPGMREEALPHSTTPVVFYHNHQSQMNRIPPGTGPEAFPHSGPPGPLDHQNQMNRIPPGMDGPEAFPHSGPPGPLYHQNQMNRISLGIGPEAFPHNGPPGPLDHQNQMNRIPPGMGPEAFPYNGPPGPLDHQNQMNRIPPGMGPEAFPHNGPPGPLDHQNQMNRIPPGMGPEAFPYNGPPGPLDHQNQMNRIPPGMGPEAFPHNGPPGPLDHQNQMNRIPPGMGPEAFPHNGPPGPLDHQNQMNWIPPGMGPEAFPHNGPPGPLDHQNQMNRIPPGMGPEAFSHNGPPGPLDHQNQMNWIPPGMGPEAFPHNGPPGPHDHQNQMNWIPPGMGPEAFPHSGPPGPLDHQNQMNRIPPGMGPEAFPHNGPPGPHDHQNQMNWIPPGMGPEAFPHSGPPGPLDHQNQMNWIPPGMGPEAFPHNGPPGPLDHQNQMNRIPPGMGPEAFSHSGPPGPLDHQNQMNRIPPGMGPEAFPHNGPPGPLDHQNQMNWIPPGMGPEAFPHNGPPGPLAHQNQMNRIPPGMGPEAFPYSSTVPIGYREILINPQFPAVPTQPLPDVAAPQRVTAIQGAIAHPEPTQQGIAHQGAQSQDPCIAGCTAPVTPTKAAGSVPTSLPSVSVTPVSEVSAAVPSVTPVSKVSAAVPSVTPVSKVSAAVPSVTPVSKVSAAVPSVTPVSKVSAAVPSVTPVSKVSAAVPSVTPVSMVSTAVPSVTPVSMVSGVVPSVTPVSMVSAAVPSVTQVSVVSAAVPSVTPVSKVSAPLPSVTPVSKISAPLPSVTPVSKVSAPLPSVTPVSKVSAPLPSVTPVSKVSAAVPSVTPVYEASPAVAGSCTIQAPPRLKTVMKGHLVVQDMETDMNESQARTLLQEFGELGEMKWPLNQKDKPARFLMINYSQRKHAERAERILNYLKVFGDNSQVKLVGGDPKGRASDLESEDLELLLNIHEVLNRIKKEILKDKMQEIPLPTQTSHNTREPVMADNVRPLHAPVTPGLTIVVSNFTDIVPVKDVNEMFVELGACGQGVLIQNALHFTFKGDSAVVNSLSGYRFPDRKMEVIVKDSANEIKPTKKPLKEVKAMIEGPLSKLMKKIGDVLKEEINNEMNVYTFKTRSCRYADGCKAKDLCLKFHDAGDRRRCLLLHRYSDEMCSDLEESGSCEAKDKCSRAHSPLEILFHYKNFRSSICPGWQQNRACDKVGRVCSYVHPEKPEMLYNNKWDNLHVEGLKRTLDYLAEAVKNLFLVKGLQCLQVLLITVSPELAKLYVDCTRELAKCCKQKVSYSAGDTIEKGTTVLITTLDALRQLLNVNNPRQSKKLDTTRLKALILDDGPALLKNCPKFIQKYLADLTRKDVNVVITAAKISNKEVKDTQDKILPSGVFKKIFVESLKKKDSKPYSSAKSGSYKIDVLERMIASTRSSDTKKTSEGQSSKNKTDKALESKSSSKEKTSTTGSSSRGSSSRSSSSKDSSSSSQNLDERIKILAALEIQYQKALAEMDEEQKQELELYTSSPEFHPEFEQKYSIFMEQYNALCPDRSDMEHANKLWGEFWKNLLTLLLHEEYNAKKQDLKNEYQDKKEKAYKGTLSQDSRGKENKQDDTKQERRSSESQKRKFSTDNRDNHREKYHRDERSSDVGRRRMNQNRNEDSYKGRRQKYSRSEFSRDSLGRGHQYHGHEKSSRYGGMQQNSNKEEFNKGRTQKSSSDVGNKESSTDMQETIHILKKLCPSLGVVGSAAQLLMSKISICLCDRQELSKLVQDDDNNMILMMLLEKAQAMKLRLPSNHVLTLLNLASLPAEKPKYYGLNIENIAKMTYNMDPSYIVQCIKNALTAQGINNASDKDVSDIYAAVTSSHFDIACSKSGEGAQPKTQESRQGDSGSLKRVSSGWSDDDDDDGDEGSRPKRGEGSWSGRGLEVNSSNVTQGRQPGGRNELGGYGSCEQFGAGSSSSSNMEFSTLGNLSSLVENFNSQQGKSSGQQGNKEDLVGMMEFLSQL